MPSVVPRLPTALEESRDLQAGELTVLGLAVQILDRITADRSAAGPIDAWATVRSREAVLAEAADLDAARARGEQLPALAGIPFGVKDLLDTAGLPTEAGSARWHGRTPDSDATAVRLARAGRGLLVGKTRTHEFAAGVTTPPTGNPFDPTRTPGGSSGGSAAAVAAGHCSWAIGTDTLGSVRMPAALCGVVGIKPTYELVSRAGVAELSHTLDHVGVLARDCADAAAALELIAGRARPPAPDRPRREFVLGVPDAEHLADLEPGVAMAYESAIDRFAGRVGARLREVRLRPGAEYVAIGFDILAREAADWHAERLAQPVVPQDDYADDVRAILDYGQRLSPEDYGLAMVQLTEVRAETDRLYKQIDVLILPSVPFVAPPRSVSEYAWPTGRRATLGIEMPRFTALGNLTGRPAVSVPVGLSSGLPVAVQLLGAANSDYALLQLAELIHERLV